MKPTSVSKNEPAFDRELSWLAFNARVLAQGEDRGVPLLERLRFLAIFQRNLDEFFMVRLPVVLRGDSGNTLSEKAQTIVNTARCLCRRMEQSLAILEEEMAAAGLQRLHFDRLTPWQSQAARRYFDEALAPLLLPLRLGPRAPLPEGEGKSLYAGLMVRCGGRCELAVEGRGLVSVTRGARAAVPNSSQDFAVAVQSMLRERGRSPVTRVEYTQGTPPGLIQAICAAARCAPDLVYVRPLISLLTGPGSSAVPQPIPRLSSWRYPPFAPRETLPQDVARSVFRRDRLLCYPYESSEPFVRLFEQAARDIRVKAICLTVYRAGEQPRILEALMLAARRGKAVTVLMELQARFDEQNNLRLAGRLIDAGCRVLYGLDGVKIHAKLGQIVYQGGQTISLFGTGNINPATARQYTDYWLMTADPGLGAEAAEWFRRVALGGPVGRFRRLLASPDGLSGALKGLIDQQIERAQQGLPCGIFLKVNSLSDKGIIRRLYRASRAGVPVRLLVRGICCLCPEMGDGIGGIEVRSIVGRFLEHSRVYCFGALAQQSVYLSSADLMPRNLHRRAELAFPVDDPRLKRRLLWQMELYWRDNVKAHRLDCDGVYRPLPRAGRRIDAQQELIHRLADGPMEARNSRRISW